MSITDELRKYVTNDSLHYCSDYLAIADRIDAEHQKAMDELRAIGGSMWQRGYGVCHDELMEGHPVIVADLEKYGWVRLPVDADGVPIHVGDVMESDYIIHTEVAAVGVECFFAWSNIDRRWHQYEANQFRHHAPDTWESIIYDAMQAGRTDASVDVTPLIERCKALCERTKEEA